MPISVYLGAMDVELFRERLRELRKRLVGSQGDLSARTKTDTDETAINPQTISDIETGAIKDPGILTIARLIDALPGMTLSEFFAQIEGNSDSASVRETEPVPSREVGDPADDEELPTPEQNRTYITLGRAIYKIVRQSQSERRPHRGPAADPRDDQAEDGVHPRGARKRPGPRKPSRRRPRKR